MLTIGTYLADRYEIINKVGAGGMSDVYKAKDHILGRFVAIKVLKQEFSEDRNFVTKFRTEAQSAAGLEHPNIVNIYDVGSEDSLHYIVMEYVEGITLKTYIEKKVQLSFKEAISIAIQVGRGIEVAHNKNIVHRDIKPQNIIISTEGKVKVTDFGIARAASANTISSDVMGSVHYSSPEQARNGYVDNRSDIYSLGIVMFEMVTGRVPFDGDTTVAVAIQHLQEEMPRPSTYAPELPISMEKIILKCAQKSPERRYQSMAELLSDLRKALINPNEDFVVITSLADTGKTKVMSTEDIEEIKGKSGKVRMEDEEEEKPTRRRSRIFDEEDEEDEDYEDEKPRRRLFFGDDEEDEEDEDEEGGLNPQMDKIVTIAGIVVAVIIVIVIIIFIFNITGIFKGKKQTIDTETQTQTQTELVLQTEAEEEVEMIDLVGMDQEDARDALSKMGLILFVKMEESEEKEGTILSQDIREGEKLKKGDTVNVVVAAAQETVEVPVVTGLTEADAVRTIESLKLLATKKYQYSDTVAAGSVISQSPSAGSAALPKSKVELVISQGVESVIVPNVTGMASTSAQSQLSQSGLIAQIVEDYSDTVTAGNVISQDIAANKTVAKNTQVTLVISKGPATVMYKFQYTVGSNAVPDNATKADIIVTDANGNEIISWKKTDIATVKGGTFSKSNIAGISSGKVTVTWYGMKTQTKEDGTTEEVEAQLDGGISETIAFEKQ